MATAHHEEPKLNLDPKYFKTVAIGGVTFSLAVAIFNHVYFMLTEEFFPILVMITPAFLFPCLVGLFRPQIAVGISHSITVPVWVRVVSTSLFVAGLAVGVFVVYAIYGFDFWGLTEIAQEL